MVGWHDRHNGHEFEQTLGDSEGQGSLACWSPWGHKEADTTERLNEGSWRLSVKNPPANAEDSGDGFNPWVGKTPWRRKWQPTPVSLSGKSHGWRAWRATVHGVAKSWTRLSDQTTI